MLSSRDAFVAQWTPKVGASAAGIRWQSSVHLLTAYLSNFVWIPLVITGAKVGEAILVVAGIATALGGLLLLLDSAWRLRHANHLTSETLGFKVGFRAVAPPPRTREHYESWCRKHGVVPYSATDL